MAFALALLPTGRITVNGPVARTSAPWGGLVADLREVILTTRPRADAELIERACEVAARCHQGQLRRSGDPYITHPVAVATILARLDDAGEVDDQTLCAAILHDTVEDTPYTLAALRRDFGAGIAAMVAEHMALDRLGRRPGRQVTHVMATITSADARVVTTKLADRLHNMQTLQFLPQANAGLQDPGGRDRRLRVRVVMHTGNVHDDDNGCFGEALDIAFRLLDAPRVKTALKVAQGPALLVVSGDVHSLVASCCRGVTGHAASRLVTVQVAGHEHQGWIHIPELTR